MLSAPPCLMALASHILHTTVDCNSLRSSQCKTQCVYPGTGMTVKLETVGSMQWDPTFAVVGKAWLRCRSTSSLATCRRMLAVMASMRVLEIKGRLAVARFPGSPLTARSTAGAACAGKLSGSSYMVEPSNLIASALAAPGKPAAIALDCH